MQFNMFPPETKWTPVDILPNWDQAEMIALDLETYDPDLEVAGPGWPWGGGFIAGVGIGIVQNGVCTAYYLPIKHQNGTNFDKRWVLSYVEEICRSKIPKVMHNCMYDMGWLKHENIKVNGPVYDTQFAAAILDENRMSYSLNNLGKDWIGEGKDENILREAVKSFGLKDAKKDMWRLPPEYVGVYGEQDCITCYNLWKYIEPKLHEEKLWKIFQLEMDLVPLLLEMRGRGIKVNLDQAEKNKVKLKTRFKDLVTSIYSDYGSKVDVWAAESIRLAFDKQNLEYGRTPTGKPSFTKEFLETHPHELPQRILKARRIEKTISTFYDGMILGHNHNGRIHTELHPLKSDEGGTVGGRFSCSHPNLQQATARDPELTPMVRGMFLPEEGCKWGALDYSSQEPRLTVHYAYITNQGGAAEAVEAYALDPKTDYHQMVADMAGIDRKPAKTINLGITYGMGGVKLCHSLGLPTDWVVGKNGNTYEVPGDDGKNLLETYHNKVPFVRGLIDLTANNAQNRGWIRTAGGRLCHFDHWEPVRGYSPAIQGKKEAQEKFENKPIRRAFTHKALNRLIQGSAADMTKLAMREIWKEGIVPMHQMHDELDFSFETESDGNKCKEIMENCMKLEVPILVDAEYGNTWADAVHKW